jgi:Tfp pilus assembly protein PilE
MELMCIIIIITILGAIAIVQYEFYQQSACSARNTQNVQELVRATESFYLTGNSFTNIVPDSLGNVPVETIANQLIAAGFLYPNPKITSVEILTKFYADAGTSTNGLPADANTGVLFFFPTMDD